MGKSFSVKQKFDASRDRVIDAYLQKETWQQFSGLPFVGDPELQSFTNGDPTEILMSYKVSIELPALAEKFIDADKMTFVEKTVLTSMGIGAFDIIPDHYKKLLKSSGKIDVVATGDDSCERLITGSVDVSLGWAGMLFEAPVEEAIVNGLMQALAAQADQIRV